MYDRWRRNVEPVVCKLQWRKGGSYVIWAVSSCDEVNEESTGWLVLAYHLTGEAGPS